MEHHFNVQIAQQFGLEEAIIVHNLFYWISKNAANGENLFEGLYWTYNSIKAYSVLFPYLSDTKVKRVFKNLEDNGVIIKGNFSDDKWVKTNWYSFPSETLNYLKSVGYDVHWLKTNCSIGSKCTNGEGQNDTMILINYTDGIPSSKTKEEDTNVSPKKVDYQAIFECWNKYNGKKIGKVTQFTEKRKRAIKKQLDAHNIDADTLMKFFEALPFADKWLYNPSSNHKTWKPTFDWWMANTNSWLTKGLEGGVHLENSQVFNNIMNGESSICGQQYTPQGHNVYYDELRGFYYYTGFYMRSNDIMDGYTDEERPDGAKLCLNNARGVIQWNANKKEWIKL